MIRFLCMFLFISSIDINKSMTNKYREISNLEINDYNFNFVVTNIYEAFCYVQMNLTRNFFFGSQAFLHCKS